MEISRLYWCDDADEKVNTERSRSARHNLRRFYEQMVAAYPEAQVIFLVQDNWPVHFHPDILQVLTHTPIGWLRLPTYAPWTNPVEKVWLRLKQEVLHHHAFVDDWQGLQQAVQNWLDPWADDPVDLLRYLGLYPV